MMVNLYLTEITNLKILYRCLPALSHRILSLENHLAYLLKNSVLPLSAKNKELYII